jgi:hypothetical protein
MRFLILLAVATASPAAAEVTSSGPTSFEVQRKAVVAAAPAAVFAQIGRVGEWWNLEHSYSGKAENMHVDLRAGGCFCETFGQGASIEHMRVIYADPATGIRMQGGLGPLQSEAVIGTLSWSFKPVAGGTELTQSYAAAGNFKAGGERMAPIVDQVLGDQFDRLVKRFAK